MQIKVFTNNWRCKNSQISIIPDIGFYRGQKKLYLTWFGITIHIQC